MKNTISCVVVFSLASFAHAEPDETIVRKMAHDTHLSPSEIRQNYDACDSGVTLSMKICGNYRWMAADFHLNMIYKQALENVKKLGAENSLMSSQRAWITYRDTTCNYDGQINSGGGSAEGLYVLSCKLEITKARVDYLEKSMKR